MEASFDEAEFSQMRFSEKLGYLYGLVLIYKTELIEILNDHNEPDTNECLYSIIMADGLANTFNCILELIEMREQFRLLFYFFLEKMEFYYDKVYAISDNKHSVFGRT